LADEEEENFKRPFIKHGLDPANVFYFAESVILKDYRGRGWGKIFFQEREQFARSLGFIDYLAFCAVERGDHHPARPKDYSPLDPFWISQGFQKEKGLVTEYEWQDRGEKKANLKKMQYWIKKIENIK
jgi:GNAT superfamily N-acetyltransferase